MIAFKLNIFNLFLNSYKVRFVKNIFLSWGVKILNFTVRIFHLMCIYDLKYIRVCK